MTETTFCIKLLGILALSADEDLHFASDICIFYGEIPSVCAEIHVGGAKHHCLVLSKLMILQTTQAGRVYPIVNQLKHLELRIARCFTSQEACHFAEVEIIIHG